jgi:ADP-ribose pyrophosphatase YjhB (NUDIX family)
MRILATTPNEFGGLIVLPESLPQSPADFDDALHASLAEWQAREARVVWLEIPAAQAELLPTALRHGFVFHHCSPGAVVLATRLAPAAGIPEAATHGIGVGGVVLSEEGNLLTVLERQDATVRPDHYKLPGGMLEPGEHLTDGIVREIREETGIRARCEGLVSLRHHHRGQFGRSNIYAVFRLRALTSEIRIDPTEIGDARWIPVAEYLASPGVGIYNRHVVRTALSAAPLPSIKLPGYMDGPESYEIF